MNEGGQSSTGQLIDFVMTKHAAYPRLLELSKKTGKSTYELLGEQLDKMQEDEQAPTRVHLTKDLHFYPDLVGCLGFTPTNASMATARPLPTPRCAA